MPSVRHSRVLGANGTNMSRAGSAVGMLAKAHGGLEKRLHSACRDPQSGRDRTGDSGVLGSLWGEPTSFQDDCLVLQQGEISTVLNIRCQCKSHPKC